MTRPSETQMHEQPNSSDHARSTCWPSPPWPIAMRPARRPASWPRPRSTACIECATLHADLLRVATQHASSRRSSDRGTSGSGRRIAAARPEPVRSPLRIVRYGPRRLQPTAGHGPHDARHCRADARDPARNAVVRWRRERPGWAGGRIGSAAGSPAFHWVLRLGAPAAPEGRASRAAGLEPTGRGRRQRRPAIAAPAPSGDESLQPARRVGRWPRGDRRRAGELPSPLSEDSTSVSQLIVISGTLLIVGLGLFALRWTSRRFGG